MSKKSLLVFFGACAAVLVIGVLFLEYNAMQGRALMAELEAGFEERLPIEERDEFYIMTDEELAAEAEAAAAIGELPPPPPVSTVVKIKGFDFGGLVPPKKDLFEMVAESEEKAKKPAPQVLDSVTVVYETGSMIVPEEEYELFINEQGEEEPVRRITMLRAPVAARLIKTQAEYDKFKKETTTHGDYPKVDFAKKAVVVLESKGALADYIFQIAEAKKEGKVYKVDYRVNILGLSTRTESHAYAVLDKGADAVELKQVL